VKQFFEDHWPLIGLIASMVIGVIWVVAALAHLTDPDTRPATRKDLREAVEQIRGTE
jgi:hypothetical protein